MKKLVFLVLFTLALTSNINEKVSKEATVKSDC